MVTIKEQIQQLNDSDLLQVWQQVCDLFKLADSHVYNNDDEFFEIWGANGSEVARAIHFGDYNYSHEYVTFNGYGNLESSNDIFELIDDTQIEDCVNQYPEQFTEWFEIEESELGNHLIVR